MIADRFAKRKILIICQSAAAVLAAALAVLSLSQRVEVWHVYVIALLLGFVTVLDQPARQVFVNELVGPKYLRNAISVNSTTFQLGGLIGPALAGVLLTAVGAGWAFAANAVACCSTVAMLLILRKDQLHLSQPTPRKKGMLREGLNYALSKPTIYWPWLMAGFVAVFAMSLPVLLAAFADNVYDAGAGGYGLLNAMVALGALMGAVASTRRRQLRLRSVVTSAGGLYGLMLCASSLMPSMVWFSVTMVLAGFWCLMFLTAANQMVQTSSNMSIRGRVMSLYLVVLIGGQAIGGPHDGLARRAPRSPPCRPDLRWRAGHRGCGSRRRTGPEVIPAHQSGPARSASGAADRAGAAAGLTRMKRPRQPGGRFILCGLSWLKLCHWQVWVFR